MDRKSSHMAIGCIVKAHGIKGEVVVFPLTPHLERFDPGRDVLLSSTPEGDRGVSAATVRSRRDHKGRVLVGLEGIENRTEAERHLGAYLVIPRGEADRSREEGEFYLHDLVGRSVRTEDGQIAGEVIDLLETQGAMMLEIGRRGEPSRLLPFVREFVKKVEDEAVIVAPPPGWEEL